MKLSKDKPFSVTIKVGQFYYGVTFQDGSLSHEELDWQEAKSLGDGYRGWSAWWT